MTKDITELTNADVFDSRDLIERIDELEIFADELDTFDREELTALTEAVDEIGSEASFGTTLIRDSYFTQYAQEFAEDIGAVNDDASWPNNYIDWDRAAHDLKMDYSIISINGTDWWYRA